MHTNLTKSYVQVTSHYKKLSTMIQISLLKAWYLMV